MDTLLQEHPEASFQWLELLGEADGGGGRINHSYYRSQPAMWMAASLHHFGFGRFAMRVGEQDPGLAPCYPAWVPRR